MERRAPVPQPANVDQAVAARSERSTNERRSPVPSDVSLMCIVLKILLTLFNKL